MFKLVKFDKLGKGDIILLSFKLLTKEAKKLGEEIIIKKANICNVAENTAWTIVNSSVKYIEFFRKWEKI